jgi:hypothetical protein
MVENKIVNDEEFKTTRNKEDADKLISEGWTLSKSQYVEIVNPKNGEKKQVVVAWVMSKIMSPKKWKCIEIPWMIKDGIRAKYTHMDIGRYNMDMHGYNTELMKLAVTVKNTDTEEFRPLTDAEINELGGKRGDMLLSVIRSLNEPSDEEIRNLP